MYDSILVATDGSDSTRPAIGHALGFAERYDATVHALSVVDVRALSFDDEDFSSSDRVLDVLSRNARRATDDIERSALGLGLDVETEVVQGTPAREIRRYADEHDIDLIAMGTRGGSGLSRRVLGSVAETVLERSPVPVLTARGTVGERSPDYARILLPTDGGAHSDRVAEHAFDIAEHYDATVHALSVVNDGPVLSPIVLAALEEESEAALTAVKQQGREREVDVVTSLWWGTPADAIRSYATDRGIDLITMGAHDRRGLDRFLTKNVARRVVRSAPCPVLTLRRLEGES